MKNTFPNGVDSFATHVFSYRYNGREYTIDVVAEDASDAKERLKMLAFARYDGELVARMPSNLGPIARAMVAIRNVTRAIVS